MAHKHNSFCGLLKAWDKLPRHVSTKLNEALKPPTQAQNKMLDGLIESLDISRTAMLYALVEHFRIRSFDQMTTNHATLLIEILQSKKTVDQQNKNLIIAKDKMKTPEPAENQDVEQGISF